MRFVPRDGVVIGCGDAERVARELRELGETRVVRYGFDAANDWRASDVMPNAHGGSDFVVWRGATRIGEFALQIPGKHNVLNALAALVVADAVGVDLQSARTTLIDFRGAARRFQVKGEFRGVTIVDDYAHHPTEIRATLAAARVRFPNRNIWAVFQPHTFTRTAALLDEFANAFGDADHVIVTKIFAAREKDDLGISSRNLVRRMQHRDAQYVAQLGDIAGYLTTHLKSGDVLVTLGAGDVDGVGEQMLALFAGNDGRN